MWPSRILCERDSAFKQEQHTRTHTYKYTTFNHDYQLTDDCVIEFRRTDRIFGSVTIYSGTDGNNDFANVQSQRSDKMLKQFFAVMKRNRSVRCTVWRKMWNIFCLWHLTYEETYYRLRSPAMCAFMLLKCVMIWAKCRYCSIVSPTYILHNMNSHSRVAFDCVYVCVVLVAYYNLRSKNTMPSTIGDDNDISSNLIIFRHHHIFVFSFFDFSFCLLCTSIFN